MEFKAGMHWTRRLLLLTFIESFATILLERAVYFYTGSVLGLSETVNLWLALLLGISYVVGALSSHRMTRRSHAKAMLRACLIGQVLIHVALFLFPSREMLFIGMALIGFCNGLKWPVIESYVSAGQPPRAASKVIGAFNVSWSTAVPVSLVVAGPLIALWPPAIFLLAAVVNACSLRLIRPLGRDPVHLADDHPERMDVVALIRYRKLLSSSRWMMFCSYTLLFLLAPLLPGLFIRLGVPLALATGLSALMDVMRVLSFLLLRRFVGWHGRVPPLLIALVALPLGFFLVLFSGQIYAVLLGELLFGLAGGMCYYAALYYAMVVSNASVDAGGDHEGLIGLGFSVGPIVGLSGKVLAGPLGGASLGMVAGVLPVMLLCIPMSLRPLWGLRRRPSTGD